MLNPLVGRLVPFLVVSALFVGSAQAHHGFGVHYDIKQQIQIEGVLQKADLRNPHSFLQVLVDGADGEQALWSCETQAKSVMLRKGIRLEQFALGQKVVVQGSAARKKENHCEINSVTFADGSDLVFRSMQGHANIGKYSAPDDGNKSIFSTWIRDSFNGAPFDPGVAEALTDAGKLANSTYDATKDDPSNQCVAANPVRAWIAPGTPVKIVNDGDIVRIEHEFMDAKRSVTMHSDPESQLMAIPQDHKPSLLGYSYGKFEDDVLTVHTAGFSSGVFLTHFQGSGVLFSNSLRMIEKYSVDSETDNLLYQWQAYDEQHFPTGIRGKLALTRAEMDIGLYDCTLTEDY